MQGKGYRRCNLRARAIPRRAFPGTLAGAPAPDVTRSPMRRTAWAAAAMLALAAVLFATPAQAHVKRMPARCTDRSAPRLCAIHFHVKRANHYRAKLGLARIHYGWIADRRTTSTARRIRILGYWTRVHARAKHRWASRPRAPWSAGWYAGAMCVHSKEGAWNSNTGNGYYGGFQYLPSTWINSGGGAYASRADLATPYEQLLVTYHVTSNSGWGQWPNTAAACGLL